MVSENQPAEPARVPASAATGAAGFLMIGTGILVAGHILFGLFIGEFGFSSFVVALALLVLMSIFGWGGIGLGTRAQKLIGFFVGIVGVLFLLDDIRFGFPDGVVDNIANIVFYIGALLMFLGARGLKE
ncbi:MAG: hypothetical protein ACRDWH_06520 [Acidimicrobiia bacterium]